MAKSLTTTSDLSPQLEGMEEGAEWNVVTHALKMPEILSKVLSYLPLEDLKSARLVKDLWKEESKLYLQQLSKVTVINGFGCFSNLDQTKIEHYLQFCESQQNFEIKLFHPYNKSILENRKVHHFAVARSSLIKSLHLVLGIYDSQDFELKFLNVLGNLSHLKELVLEVELLGSCWENLDVDEAFQAMPQLPFVTKLESHWYFDFPKKLKESDNPKLKNLCQKLLSMTPNLEQLTPVVANRHMNYQFVSVYFGEILRLQEEWKESKSTAPKPFQKLAFIRLKLDHTSNYSEEILKSCLKFSQPLKGLKIGISHSISSPDKESTLQRILQKNFTTLKKLEIICLYENEHFNNTINLPDGLPRLARLSLYQCAFNLRELLMMGPAEFNSRFPCLHSLELSEFEGYLPLPNCQIDLSFPQFTSLRIIGKTRFWSESDQTWAEWLSKLFPNVHNPWINEARQKLQEKMQNS